MIMTDEEMKFSNDRYVEYHLREWHCWMQRADGKVSFPSYRQFHFSRMLLKENYELHPLVNNIFCDIILFIITLSI